MPEVCHTRTVLGPLCAALCCLFVRALIELRRGAWEYCIRVTSSECETFAYPGGMFDESMALDLVGSA